MKTQIIVFMGLITLLSLISCNRDQAGTTGAGAGIEKEETVPNKPGQTPGFEKEEYRKEYEGDDANITTPIEE